MVPVGELQCRTSGAPGVTRTPDPLLRRQLLCPLSYGGKRDRPYAAHLWFNRAGLAGSERDVGSHRTPAVSNLSLHSRNASLHFSPLVRQFQL